MNRFEISERFGETEIQFTIEEVPQYLYLHGECINAVMSDFITGNYILRVTTKITMRRTRWTI